MTLLYIVLYILALICFGIATAGRYAGDRINFIALGLFFTVTVFLVQLIDAVA